MRGKLQYILRFPP